MINILPFDVKNSILDENLMFPKHIHELALVSLENSYQTLVLQPFEQQIKHQQTQYLGYSEEDLASELSTKLALKELEGFKSLYWLARANDLKDIVSFVETEKKDCSLLFFSETRNDVVSKLAEVGDHENIDKLLNLAIEPSDRMTMLTSVIDGSCKGGQIDILHNLFEEKCQTEHDKTSCQNYLTEEVSRLFGNACASGNLDSVEFLLARIPETEHKRIISEVDQGFRYHALREACQSGNTEIVDRLLKPFSQDEIDRIFLPSSEETRALPLPFPYTNVLSYDSVKINQHILSKVVSPQCREEIVTSETFIHPLAKSYIIQEEERSLGLLTQVPIQQFELVRQGVTLALDKQDPEVAKQRFEKDCEGLKNPLSVSKSRLTHSQFFSEASTSHTENQSTGTRLRDSLFFNRFSEQAVDETEKDKKDKQRCQASRLTKN
ncbi:MAG: ankyrin repeat domain-containing protein [Gammaproteobacteria bacterium]|nr:MAG: ankyrin repeat domain-containing protein [Gammaproteobacteria bacterium]